MSTSSRTPTRTSCIGACSCPHSNSATSPAPAWPSPKFPTSRAGKSAPTSASLTAATSASLKRSTSASSPLAVKQYAGKVKNIGGTSGPPWDRRFEARISLDQAAPELRPGMTSNMVITVDTLDNILWIPSQALFESDGRTFVYARGPNGFVPHDVALVRRSESQAVITGIKEGETVAMSNPDQQLKSGATPNSGAMKALSQ